MVMLRPGARPCATSLTTPSPELRDIAGNRPMGFSVRAVLLARGDEPRAQVVPAAVAVLAGLDA